MTEQQHSRNRSQNEMDAAAVLKTTRNDVAPSNDAAKLPWWSEEYDFFGDFYMEGDDSKEDKDEEQ